MDEDEVSDQVSTLKKIPTSTDDDILGIATASFRWNEVKEPPPDEPKKTWRFWKRFSFASSTSDDTSKLTSASLPETPFELRDISVIFPKGQLTVVTGPTASGKTALLMCVLQIKEAFENWVTDILGRNSAR